MAWRFLLFQKDSALAQWFQARTADGRKPTRKTMIVALARKLVIPPSACGDGVRQSARPSRKAPQKVVAMDVSTR
nr:hypothetical protein [Pseudaminobacter manganicus]